MRHTFLLFLAFLLLPLSATRGQQKASSSIPYGHNAKVGRYAAVNGIRMYYEIYGQGAPLVLIHGNGGSIADMAPQIPFFSQHYRVIVADSRAQGNSTGIGPALTYEQMAEDWAALLDQLHVDSAYVYGWSDGGINGLLLAMHHPEKVKRLAAMGANLQPDTTALYPWFVQSLARDTRRLDSLQRTTTDPKQRQQVQQQRQLIQLMADHPHIPFRDLAAVKAPTLVMCGDRDVITLPHTVRIFRSLPKAQLCVFPGATHMISQQDPQRFNQMLYRFFSQPFTMPATRQ